MTRRPPASNTGNPVIDTGSILTQKQKAFVQEVVAGKPIQEAAAAAGYAPSVATSDAYRFLSQPAMQAHLRAVFEDVGLPIVRQAEILRDAAEKAETMIVDKNGNRHYNRDYRTSIEAVRIAMAGTGLIGPRGTENTGGTTVNITIDNRALPSTDAIDVTPES